MEPYGDATVEMRIIVEEPRLSARDGMTMLRQIFREGACR